MKIVAISDLHGILPKSREFTPCDVIIIAGDISPLHIQKNSFDASVWFGYTFLHWCETLPCTKVIVIGGNHDFFLDDNQPYISITRKFCNNKVIYLKNSGYKWSRKRFFGLPFVQDLPPWAFNISDEQAQNIYQSIPDCDVLITHTPPFDAAATGRVYASNDYPDYGSVTLHQAIKNKNIDLIICGHVHSGNHALAEWENHKIVNVSYLDEEYRPHYTPRSIII